MDFHFTYDISLKELDWRFFCYKLALKENIKLVEKGVGFKLTKNSD